jgi:ATP-binding cassette, subfamily B, bacterial AbcA/BmrA
MKGFMDDHDEKVREVHTISDYMENAKDSIKALKWLWVNIVTEESKKHLRKMFLFLFLVTLLSTFQFQIVSYLFTGLQRHDGFMTYEALCGFTLCIVLLKYFSYKFQQSREWSMGFHWRKLDTTISTLFYEKSVAQHQSEASQLSVTSISKGRGRINDLQGILFFDGIEVVLQLFISLACLFWLNWRAGLVMFGVLLVYVVWGLYLSYRVTKECTSIEKDWRVYNRVYDEVKEKVERVKVCGHEKLTTEEMQVMYAKVIIDARNFWLWFIDNAALRSMVNLFCLVATISIGAWYVWSGQWNIGLMFPLFMWASRVSDNLWKIGDLEHKINWNMPSVKLMVESLEMAPTIVDMPNAKTLDHTRTHKIEFIGVSHTYKVGEEDGKANKYVEMPAALVNVNFSIEEGEKVGCLGRSGVGKSTVMKKLLRFDDPTSGLIAIDGIDMRQYTQDSWRKGIGYIPQQAQIFDGTIRSNLIYGLDKSERERVTDEELWELMALLKIDFKKRLTDGLDTKVGKNGLKLSGGEAQRLMIGSAVIKKPWLLVVDEATASLDSDTEHYVQEGLAKALSANTSALIVAHRLSTIRTICDKFVVLRPAFEVPEGESQVEAVAYSFEELYEISPTFRGLADRQGIMIGQKTVLV